MIKLHETAPTREDKIGITLVYASGAMVTQIDHSKLSLIPLKKIAREFHIAMYVSIS